MFLRKGKSESPLEGKHSPQENDGAEEKDPLVAQITNLEELVNKRTKDLEEARQQLSGLHDTTKSFDGDDSKDESPVEELFTLPNQVKDEPSAVSEKEQPVELIDTASLMGETNVEEDEQEEKKENDAPLNFFSTDEDVENPLASLINSLPEVTTQELVAEAKQVTTMLREWQGK